MKKGKMRIVPLVIAAVLGVSLCAFAAEEGLQQTAESALPESSQIKEETAKGKNVFPGKLQLQINQKNTKITACVMVPMTKTAEMLGFDVINMKIRKKGERRYCLDDRKTQTIVTLGKNRYQITRMKGGKEVKRLALWKDDTYTYSLRLSKGETIEIWKKVYNAIYDTATRKIP